MDPGRRVASLAERLDAFAPLAAGTDRDGALGSLLVDAGMLAQALADSAFESRGVDAPDPAADRALEVCVAIARELDAGRSRELAAVRRSLEALRAAALPATVEERVPEGFAHYAVLPECYLAAAREAPRGDWTVLGIRSIGTTLAALVAAALDAHRVATVRPVGAPYARTLALSPEARARLLEQPAALFAVVDEGPGASGSSFLAVVRALEAAGVAPSRIHLFPSHRGEPGAAASEDTLRRWRAAPRHVVTLDELALGHGRALLEWFEGTIPGGAAATLEDLSAGAWRGRVFADERAWPATFAQQERRKLSITARGERWLAEFVGLGRVGTRRVERAQVLAGAGFGVPVAALHEGFAVRRWVEATALDRVSAARGDDRRALLDALPRYLALRATMELPEDAGASVEELARMLHVNAVEALGEDAGPGAARLLDAAPANAGARRVAVDGKLEPWEWLRLPGDGTLVKADALQHADGHDLVGAQPISWDVAGAIAELELSPAEAEALVGALRRDTGAALAPEELAFLAGAYAAFRLARWTFALCSEGSPRERARIERERARYRRALGAAISAAPR